MGYTIETKEINENLRIRIVETENLNNPQENCYFDKCEFVLNQNRYFEPENSRSLSDFELVGEIEADSKIISEATGKKAFPLYAYIHSCVRLSLSPFSCPWDSGCLGFVLAENEEIAKLFVESWDNYLNKPNYGFIVEEREPLFNKNGEEVSEEWNEIESCYGYGSDESAMNEAMNFIPVKE